MAPLWGRTVLPAVLATAAMVAMRSVSGVTASGEADAVRGVDVPTTALAEEDACEADGMADSGSCSLSMRQLRGQQRAVAAHSNRADADSTESLAESQAPWWPSCQLYGCGTPYTRAHMCQCNEQCARYGNCCIDYGSTCKTAAPTPAPPPAPLPPPPASLTPVPFTPSEPTASPVTPPAPVPEPTPPPQPLEPGHVVGEDPDCHTAAPGDAVCYVDVRWAMQSGIRQHPSHYDGLTAASSFEQFQYWFYKKGLGGCKMPCGIKPAPSDPHAVLTREVRGVPPPTLPFEYNGIAWPTMTIRGTEVTHFFAVGDWGGLAGQLPHNSQIIQYAGGQTPGPHTMGRYRTDPKYHFLICSTPQMADCFGTQGKLCTGLENITGEKCCEATCGWNKDVDVPAQNLVATQMKERARTSDPKYILNVGDNFYWGGVYGKCGETPMTRINDITQTQFKWIFEDIYSGPGLDGKPWLTVLGNHDWGGREFTAAWDQQIAYTWTSDRWVLPAAYWMQHVEYPDQNFTVDIFMTDSNIVDALENVSANPEHNICGAKHNAKDASCASVGGMPSVDGCHAWFQELWNNGSAWVTEKLRHSTADWQILVTHFPCGHYTDFYRELHLKYGLDLMVTGHVHFQMMYWDPNRLGGMTCFITGGGGGITSENEVDMLSGKDHQYGFYDLTITKSEIGIESINWNGTTIGTWTVHPTVGTDTPAARNAPCHTAQPGEKCYDAVTWAMRDGIHGHPLWYPSLTPSSSFADFQGLLYRQHKSGCRKPC